MISSLEFYRRSTDISPEEFGRLWSEVYGPLFSGHPELKRHLPRYVQHQLAPNTDKPTRMVRPVRRLFRRLVRDRGST